ncbi:hypothetical protein AGMMS4957_09740 [Bacteroidia bacterium]|nr:hypothetical protein AGMMS4957_09740 [Bacteroidia bacterium]
MKHTILIIGLLCSAAIHAKDKPGGLRTDLLEHTDRTWQNGYLSNIPVWRLDAAIEPLQYVQIGSLHPAFSWLVPGTGQATRQTAYRIIVADAYKDAAEGHGSVWDSGQTNSDLSVAVKYAGQALQPNTNYFWRVKTVTNTGGESDWSDIKAFRTAATLSEYATSFYPQVKTMEHAVAIHPVASGVTVVDFGKDAFGQAVLTLTSKSGADSVTVHLGEILSGNRVDRKPPGTIRYHRYPLLLLPGTHTYRIKIEKDRRNTGSAAILMPAYVGEVMPFRYCEIEGYNTPLTAANVVRESVHYPFDETASSFQCSNDTLNQIWDFCKYSVKATTFAGIYVDGDRERIPYEADALINQLCHYAVENEYAIARRSHEYLLQHPTWPTEWILQAVLIAWNDYLYTGDERSLKANYNILKARTLAALKEKNGLISTTTGLQTPEFASQIRFFKEPLRDIVDWPHTSTFGQEGGEDDGFVYTDYNAVTNAYHYEALKRMAQLAGASDRQDEAASYARQAEAFKALFNRSFYNPETGTYKDGISTDHSSLHANIFPLVFDMAPIEKKPKIAEFIRSRGMACSVYGSQFLMDALYEAADAEYALSMLTKTDDRSWYNMIRVGSTISLEAWDNKYKPNQDWNHVWGAAAGNIIARKLMGIEPLEPGFKKIRIKPQPATLSRAEIQVPSIRGDIRVAFENQPDKRFALQVEIPANSVAEVWLPKLSAKYKITRNEVGVKGTVDGNFVKVDTGSGKHLFIIEALK